LTSPYQNLFESLRHEAVSLSLFHVADSENSHLFPPLPFNNSDSFFLESWRPFFRVRISLLIRRPHCVDRFFFSDPPRLRDFSKHACAPGMDRQKKSLPKRTWRVFSLTPLGRVFWAISLSFFGVVFPLPPFNFSGFARGSLFPAVVPDPLWRKFFLLGFHHWEGLFSVLLSFKNQDFRAF